MGMNLRTIIIAEIEEIIQLREYIAYQTAIEDKISQRDLKVAVNFFKEAGNKVITQRVSEIIEPSIDKIIRIFKVDINGFAYTRNFNVIIQPTIKVEIEYQPVFLHIFNTISALDPEFCVILKQIQDVKVGELLLSKPFLIAKQCNMEVPNLMYDTTWEEKQFKKIKSHIHKDKQILKQRLKLVWIKYKLDNWDLEVISKIIVKEPPKFTKILMSISNSCLKLDNRTPRNWLVKNNKLAFITLGKNEKNEANVKKGINKNVSVGGAFTATTDFVRDQILPQSHSFPWTGFLIGGAVATATTYGSWWLYKKFTKPTPTQKLDVVHEHLPALRSNNGIPTRELIEIIELHGDQQKVQLPDGTELIRIERGISTKFNKLYRKLTGDVHYNYKWCVKLDTEPDPKLHEILEINPHTGEKTVIQTSGIDSWKPKPKHIPLRPEIEQLPDGNLKVIIPTIEPVLQPNVQPVSLKVKTDTVMGICNGLSPSPTLTLYGVPESNHVITFGNNLKNTLEIKQTIEMGIPMSAEELHTNYSTLSKINLLNSVTWFLDNKEECYADKNKDTGLRFDIREYYKLKYRLEEDLANMPTKAGIKLEVVSLDDTTILENLIIIVVIIWIAISVAFKSRIKKFKTKK